MSKDDQQKPEPDETQEADDEEPQRTPVLVVFGGGDVPLEVLEAEDARTIGEVVQAFLAARAVEEDQGLLVLDTGAWAVRLVTGVMENLSPEEEEEEDDQDDDDGGDDDGDVPLPPLRLGPGPGQGARPSGARPGLFSGDRGRRPGAREPQRSKP